MDKKPAKPSKVNRVMNSTLSGRPTPSVPPSSSKDVKTKRIGVRGPNQSVSEQTFAAPASLTGPEKDCELKLEYNQLLQSIFMDSMLEETEEREKTELDGMMAILAERCEKNVELLEKTHKRLNEISFLAEKQRILDMKENDTTKFFQNLDASKAENVLTDLTRKQQSYIDRIETKNVDLGYNEKSGHQQLLETMEDALRGLESIRLQSKLTPEVIEQYSKFNGSCEKVESQMRELEDLRKQFDEKFPSLSEKAIIRTSEELTRVSDDNTASRDD